MTKLVKLLSCFTESLGSPCSTQIAFYFQPASALMVLICPQRYIALLQGTFISIEQSFLAVQGAFSH